MYQLVLSDADAYGPLIPEMDGADRLWQYRGRKPRAWMSLLLWQDGTVVKTPHPDIARVNACDYAYIGGHDLLLDAADWRYTVLVNAGYTFREVP